MSLFDVIKYPIDTEFNFHQFAALPHTVVEPIMHLVPTSYRIKLEPRYRYLLSFSIGKLSDEQKCAILKELKYALEQL